MKYCYDYPRPALTVDGIILSGNKENKQILLIQRLHEPFKDTWALPGGFVDENETAEEAVDREIEEEVSLNNLNFKQVFTVSNLNRDPRGRTVSIIYYTFVNANVIAPKAADDAKSVKWFKLSDLPLLAFDHEYVIKKALQLIRKE
jgi:8-oxo-dGTP diphosphatase